ncbi:MAG: hypothetical protein E6K55_07485 [Gemmatimonadetes bacterium]|nr:MAG: hypothetical protein E6K55_07485 [Gemmatimonadota bacterium]
MAAAQGFDIHRADRRPVPGDPDHHRHRIRARRGRVDLVRREVSGASGPEGLLYAREYARRSDLDDHPRGHHGGARPHQQPLLGPDHPIGVHAKQFEWQVTYPGADGKLGTADDFTVRNQLHVPVGRPIVVQLSSEDVIHSFYVPQFRVRQDVVPGMDIKAWFQATVPGTYELGCSQLCGLGHYRMRAQVFVQTQEDYDAWMKQAAQEASQ